MPYVLEAISIGDAQKHAEQAATKIRALLAGKAAVSVEGVAGEYEVMVRLETGVSIPPLPTQVDGVPVRVVVEVTKPPVAYPDFYPDYGYGPYYGYAQHAHRARRGPRRHRP